MAYLGGFPNMDAFAFRFDPDMLAENIIFLDQAQERSFYGRQAVIGRYAGLLHCFSERQIDVKTLMIEEQGAVIAFQYRARHNGPFMGIPPTLKEVDVPMVMICRMESGKIAQAELYYNAGTLLRQLGLG